MYNLPPEKEKDLGFILRSLPENMKRNLQTILALIFNAGYNKGLKAGGRFYENHRRN